MKKLLGILSAVLLAGSLTACGSEEHLFGTDVSDDGNTLINTSKNAEVGTANGSGMDIAEGEMIVVTSTITKGAVTFRAVRNSDSADTQPSVEWEFSSESEIEYELEPGDYMFGFTVTGKGATGTITVTKKANPNATVAADAAGDVQNPVMNFVGTYASGRCSILVEADGDENAKFTIMWGSSAAETTEWTMSGKLNTETLTVDYSDCVKKNLVFNEDGNVETEDVVYENGTGTITFNGSTLTWVDNEENAAEDMVFDYVSGN